jgi:hypothetical protein
VGGRGAPFAFWAHLGSPERLLVYFDGGGFCWDYRSCAPAASLFKDQVTDIDDPERHGTGILDLANPDNPFRGWSVLHVPSCSGDLFTGASTRTYRSGDRRVVTVHHRGRVNATAALDWIFQRVPPTRVVVAGCSAGSVGSVLHAVADHCALSSDRFHELRSSRVTLRNWVADLAVGRDVPNLPRT